MNKPSSAAMRAAEQLDAEEQLRHAANEVSRNQRILDAARTIDHETGLAELIEALRECLGFIEMKLAHNGVQNVDQILKELAHVQKHVSEVSTAHSLGCSKTTRRVNLAKVRALLAKSEGTAHE